MWYQGALQALYGVVVKTKYDGNIICEKKLDIYYSISV